MILCELIPNSAAPPHPVGPRQVPERRICCLVPARAGESHVTWWAAPNLLPSPSDFPIAGGDLPSGAGESGIWEGKVLLWPESEQRVSFDQWVSSGWFFFSPFRGSTSKRPLMPLNHVDLSSFPMSLPWLPLFFNLCSLVKRRPYRKCLSLCFKDGRVSLSVPYILSFPFPTTEPSCLV